MATGDGKEHAKGDREEEAGQCGRDVASLSVPAAETSSQPSALRVVQPCNVRMPASSIKQARPRRCSCLSAHSTLRGDAQPTPPSKDRAFKCQHRTHTWMCRDQHDGVSRVLVPSTSSVAARMATLLRPPFCNNP